MKTPPRIITFTHRSRDVIQEHQRAMLDQPDIHISNELKEAIAQLITNLRNNQPVNN